MAAALDTTFAGKLPLLMPGSRERPIEPARGLGGVDNTNRTPAFEEIEPDIKPQWSNGAKSDGSNPAAERSTR